MPFRKNSPFLPSVQKALVKLRQNGVVDKIEAEYKLPLKLKELVDCDAGQVIQFKGSNDCSICKPTRISLQLVPLGISQTFFPFACLLVGVGLAIAAILMETVKPWIRRSDIDEYQIKMAKQRSLRKIIFDKIMLRSVEELEAIANTL